MTYLFLFISLIATVPLILVALWLKRKLDILEYNIFIIKESQCVILQTLISTMEDMTENERRQEENYIN